MMWVVLVIIVGSLLAWLLIAMLPPVPGAGWTTAKRSVHNVVAHPLLERRPPLGEWLHARTEPPDDDPYPVWADEPAPKSLAFLMEEAAWNRRHGHDLFAVFLETYAQQQFELTQQRLSLETWRLIAAETLDLEHMDELEAMNVANGHDEDSKYDQRLHEIILRRRREVTTLQRTAAVGGASPFASPCQRAEHWLGGSVGVGLHLGALGDPGACTR